MATITFSNGVKVNFNGTPTDADVQEVAQKIGLKGAVAPAPAAPPKKDLLDKAADVATSIFPGTKQIGESLGGLAVGAKELFTGHPDVAKSVVDSGPSVPKLIGAYTAAGAEAAGAALPGAETVAGSAAQLGALGAAAGGGASLANGNNAKTVAADAFKAGLTGAVIGGTTKLAGNLIQKALTKAPEKLYSSVLKVTPKLQQAGKNPSKFLIDKGLWGTTGTLYGAAQQGIDEANSQIEQKLAADTSHINTKEVLSKVQSALEEKFGATVGKANIEATIQNLPIESLLKNDTISAADANEVRQQLDQLLGDRYFLASSPTTSIGRQALGEVAGVLRNTVKDATGTHAEFGRLSKFITTRDLLDTAIASADTRLGLGLRDIGISGVGAISGGPLGAAATVTGKKLLGSTAVRTGGAVLLDRLNNIPTDALGRISRAAVVRLLQEYGGTDAQTPPTAQQ